VYFIFISGIVILNVLEMFFSSLEYIIVCMNANNVLVFLVAVMGYRRNGKSSLHNIQLLQIRGGGNLSFFNGQCCIVP